MKINNKAFTLIELLAVIVILAIIALIATPIVLNIISNTKESSQLRSAEMYLDGVEQAVMMKKMKDTTFNPNTCIVLEGGNLECDGDKDNSITVEVEGDAPLEDSIITFNKGKINKVNLKYETKTVTKDAIGNLIFALAPGLYDENDVLVASWDDLVNVYGLNIALTSSMIGAPANMQPTGTITNIMYVNTELQSGIKLVVPSGITRIGGAQFSSSSIKYVDLSNTVGVDISSAFYGAKSLISVELPIKVKIGYATFLGCTSLLKITIPSGVTSFGDNAFNGCTSLSEIIIPSSLTSIGSFAFSGCTNLKTINYTDTESEWNAITFGSNWNNGCPEDMVINYNYVAE